MGYGSKHVRFSSDRPVFRGRNQHVRSNGYPKVRHESLEAALEVVLEMRADGKDVQAYQCECDGYHVGNRRHMDKVPDRDIAMFIELGDRVYAHMRSQNGRRQSRLKHTMGVLIRAREKRLYE